MIMAEFLKDSGKMIEDMGKDLKDIVMATLMKEIFVEVKLMDKELTIGKTEKFMKVNG
jgi:hypothetical protein